MTPEVFDHANDGAFADEAASERAVRLGRRGLYVTPRQTFVGLAVILGVVLMLLIAYLLWLLTPGGITQRGGTAQAGIQPVFEMYGPGSGKLPKFANPMGAAWGLGDRIYVADTKNSRVVVFDHNGRYLFQFGGFGIAKPLRGAAVTWKPGLLDYPTGIATDPDNGDVYVADFYNDSISVFDSKGAFLRRFPDPYKPTGKGSSGAGGTGIAATALTIAQGKVYATDAYQVFVFDKSGKVLEQFGMPGGASADLDHPNGIAVDGNGHIYVADSNHNRVTAFSPQGSVLWTVGKRVSQLQAKTNNPFVLPRGLTVMRDGSLLVADPLGQQLVMVGQTGKIVGTFGLRGSDPGQLNFPNDVDAKKDLILIADRENNRVQVVRLTAR